MTTEINSFLDNLNPDWQPIKEQANRYFDSDSKIRDDGAVQIFRQPWIAPLKFGLLFFPPVNKKWFDKFHIMTNKTIPTFYQKILSNINGCFVYDFSLYGLPKTMYEDGILNRRILQQYDLGTANTTWIHGYEVDKNLFHISGRQYSYDENIGYFYDGGKILSFSKNGKLLNSWTDFSGFLNSEITIAEQMMIKERGSKISNP